MCKAIEIARFRGINASTSAGIVIVLDGEMIVGPRNQIEDLPDVTANLEVIGVRGGEAELTWVALRVGLGYARRFKRMIADVEAKVSGVVRLLPFTLPPLQVPLCVQPCIRADRSV